MKKINIQMMVQGFAENSQEFADRLEKACNVIMTEKQKNISFIGIGAQIPPLVSLTSDATGRQTATIQYFTEVYEAKGTVEEAAFDGKLLRQAFAEYQYKKHSAGDTLEYFKKEEEFLRYLLEYNKAV